MRVHFNRRLSQVVWPAHCRSRQPAIPHRIQRMVTLVLIFLAVVQLFPLFGISLYFHGIFSWSGRRLWGLSLGDVSINNITSPMTPEATNTLTMSFSEKMNIREKLKSEFQLVNASGAGYKMLCVIDG